MNLNQWAIKWGVPFEAVEDLRREFGTVDPDNPAVIPGESEAAVQTRVRLEASRVGGRLFRNNVGGTYTEDGTFLRYGLANDSKKMNDSIKSSDLIGLRPVRIGPEHVGNVFGLFVAREIKPGNWRYMGTPRELAQLKFIELVASLGGDASFAIGEGTLQPY